MEETQRDFIHDYEFIDLYVSLGVDGTESKEQQDEFNFRLMKILDRIENNMDKKTYLSRSRSHRYHDDKRK
jgi:hypothetical protein